LSRPLLTFQDDPPEDHPEYELRVAAPSQFVGFLEKPDEFTGEEVALVYGLGC